MIVINISFLGSTKQQRLLTGEVTLVITRDLPVITNA